MNKIEQIAISSPWWTNKEWHVNDRNIKLAKQSGINFKHLKSGIDIKPSAIDIIRGPRQIGKTTELKFIIYDLLQKGINPKSIGYFPCDVISKPKELYEFLQSFHQHIEINKIEEAFFALDEITSVKDWQKAVKSFIDLGLCEKIHLVLTGSSSIELKKGYERMPGRRNGGKDFLFLPVSFSDYSKIVNPSKDIISGNLFSVISSEENFNEFMNNALISADFYRENLRNYLKVGGFLRTVADFTNFGEVSEETLQVYQSVLFSEFEKYGKNIITLMKILSEIQKNVSNPVSFHSIAENCGIASADTVKEYIEMLQMAYLGLEVHCADISKKRAFSKKNKKFYSIDPIIFAVISEKFHMYPIDEAKIAENILAVHIARFFLNEWSNIGILDKIFYWKSKKGKEVDFLIFLDGNPFGVELKYQKVVSAWDEVSLKKGLGNGALVTKDTFEYGKIPKIPLWAFLLLSLNKRC